MKKLGKKLSFLTKVMLVVGLLISNLSSLSVVFAYEATGAVQITVVEDKLNIKYTDELAEEVESVNVNVYENYTYLDGSSYYLDELAVEPGKISNKSLTSEELMASEGFDVESILSVIDFDGLYEVKVEILDSNDEVIDFAIYSENITHESGLVFKVLDSTDTEIVPVNGVYPVSVTNSKVNVVAQILSGGLSPLDQFLYDELEYTASELIEYEFSSEMDFNGYLYGEYTLPFEVKLLDSNSEEVLYSDDLDIMYESYEMNASVLNDATEELELDETYVFSGDSKDGILYVLLNAEKINTMLDLYKLMDLAVGENEIISYVLSNSEYEDVLASYDGETAEVTLDEYLESIVLDDTTVLSLVNEGLTVTYNVVVVADVNGDNSLTEDDLLGLVDQVVGVTEVNVEKSDINRDEKVDTLDVMYLNQIIKTGTWEVALNEIEATVGAGLVVNATDIVSGDEFTVDYVLTVSEFAVNGIAGLFNYDDTMLELVSVEVANEWLGNNKDGKFLYLGTESLTGTEVEDGNNGLIIEPKEYVVVTATFKALKAGESSVILENSEYFDETNYLVVEQEEVTATVVVNASDNNSLSSLTVAGQTIVLEKNENGEDVLEYEITVSNDVTMAEVEAVVENVAANITSIVYPEELAEGKNTVTITVTSENGDIKVYTIIVNREAAPEEETVTTPVNNNYYNEYEEEKEDVVTPIPSDDEEVDEYEEEEESNLSRIVIIILILLVIAGLVYLIFKDDQDEETKKANKAVNRLRKEEVDAKVEKTANTKSESKPVNKSNNRPNNNKNKASNNNKKER